MDHNTSLATAVRGGLLLLDKPTDFTSNDMVAIARRVLHTKRIGHSGTLDPMATGLLILLVERQATRLQNRFLTLDKEYQATLQLGVDTDTWDRQGNPVGEQKVPALDLTAIEQAVHTLTGTVRQQIPPFSAKKIKGQKMYDLARNGQPVADRYNEIKIFAWKNFSWNGKDELSFTLHCSCGTYVRSVARRLAQLLGTTGHLTQLRRTRIGPFHVQTAFDGNKLKTTSREEIVKWLQEPQL